MTDPQPTGTWTPPSVTVRSPLPEHGYGYSYNRTSYHRREDDGWHWMVVLDTTTGILTAWANTGTTLSDFKTNRSDYYNPGSDLAVSTGIRLPRTARRLAAPLPASPVGLELRCMLLRVAARADEMLPALEPVESGGWDWTLDAAVLWRAIVEHVGMRRPPSDDDDIPILAGDSSGLITLERLLELCPKTIDRTMKVDDPDLDKRAVELGDDYLFQWRDQLRDELGDPTLHSVQVVGARTGLRAARAAWAREDTGLRVETARAWFGDGRAPHVPDDMTDSDLMLLADEIIREARDSRGVFLVAVASYLKELRAARRAAVRASAEQIGRDHIEMVDMLAGLRLHRAAAVTRICSWRDKDDLDRDGKIDLGKIGRLVGLEPQAVQRLLDQIAAEYSA